MRFIARLIVAFTLGCGVPSLAAAQLSSADTRAAREALYVARFSISAADLNRVNAALITSNGLSLKADTAAARIVRAVRVATGDVYATSIDALASLIGVAPSSSAPPAPPPPVVVAPPSAPTAARDGVTVEDVRRIVAEEIAKASTTGALANVVPVTETAPGDVGFQFNTSTVTHRLYGNSEDYGLRLWFNYREPYVNGSSYSVPSLPQMALFFEQDGVASFIYGRPQTTAPGPYDRLGGKDLAIRAGGWNDAGQRDKFVSIYSGNVGRGLQLGVSRTHANYPDAFDFQIDPDQLLSPVSIRLGGSLRQLVPCNISGVEAVCYK